MATAPEKAAASKRQVQLQINTSGAWRKVITFDASDQQHAGQVMESAPVLAEIGGGTLRIVTDDGMQTALAMWSLKGGWIDFVTRKAIRGTR